MAESGGRDEQLWRDQEALSIRPTGHPVMYQRWSNLTFLHWRVEPEVIQSLLPEELTVDTFDGSAYVGLVPFTMSGIRPRGLPIVPRLSAFHETNVRTYVHVRGRDPGVWFFSLEAANRLAVTIARRWFGLPYFWADMSIRQSPDGRQFTYETSRRKAVASTLAASQVSVRGIGDSRVAEPRTIEAFLIERYQLYSRHLGRLKRGCVAHPPYRFCEVEPVVCQGDLVQASVDGIVGMPDFAHFSPGVSVEVFGLQESRTT